jgi:hypothetical protein
MATKTRSGSNGNGTLGGVLAGGIGSLADDLAEAVADQVGDFDFADPAEAPAARAKGRGARAAKEPKPPKVQTITITPPNILEVRFKLVGTSPLLQARFSGKARQAMMDKMAAGSTAKKSKERAARDFDEDMRQAIHFSEDGWVGHPASAFRNASIDVCRLVNFKMTLAKMSLFCQADGRDRVDGMPLVKLLAGEPERTEMAVRNATGVADIRIRPMWRDWSMEPVMEYDADQFTLQDLTNLVARVGRQVGIGEGRHYSRSSAGMGYGCFKIEGIEPL